MNKLQFKGESRTVLPQKLKSMLQSSDSKEQIDFLKENIEFSL